MTHFAGVLSPNGAGCWPRSWDNPEHVQDGKAARRLITGCLERNRRMMAALSQLRTSGSSRSAQRMARRYLQSFSARLHALAVSYQRKVSSLRDAPANELLELVTAAGALCPWRGSDEKAVAYKKPKRDGSFRWIHRHGLMQYALEILTANAAKAISSLMGTQFITRGGVPKFDQWLQQHAKSGKTVLTVDIPRCFDTVCRGSLVDNLLLPKWVVRKVLFDPMDKATYLQSGLKEDTDNFPSPIASVSSAGRGIPQGSALSQIAAEIVIGRVLQAVSDIHPSVHVASHGDNLIILLDDASFEASVISTLTSAVTEHFGVDVSAELTCRISRDRPSGGFWFCRRHYRWKGGKLTIGLPPNWVGEFELRVLMKVEEARAAKSEDQWDRLERRVKGWLRNQPKADAVVDTAAELLAHIKLLRKTPLHETA